MFTYANNHKTFFWEYGDIAKNIVSGKGYSLFYQEDGRIDFHYKLNTNPYPSAYMPPGYVAFLAPFMRITNPTVQKDFIFLVQITFSLLTIFLLYLFTLRLFGQIPALAASLIYALLPEFIYSTFTIGPTVFFHFLIILLFYLLIFETHNLRTILIIGFICSLLIFLRTEFLIFSIFIFVYFLIKRYYKFGFTFLIVISVLVSPWIIRNYLVFNEFPILTTNFGVNFYRGNNPYEIGVWADKEIALKLRNFSSERNYEIFANKMYRREATEFIQTNPLITISNSIKKAVFFISYYSADKRANSLIYLFPWAILLILSLSGIFHSAKDKKLILIYIFLVVNVLLAMVFLPLLRYQTMMKIALLPFAGMSINLIIVKFKKKINK